MALWRKPTDLTTADFHSSARACCHIIVWSHCTTMRSGARPSELIVLSPSSAVADAVTATAPSRFGRAIVGPAMLACRTVVLVSAFLQKHCGMPGQQATQAHLRADRSALEGRATTSRPSCLEESIRGEWLAILWMRCCGCSAVVLDGEDLLMVDSAMTCGGASVCGCFFWVYIVRLFARGMA